MNLHKVNMFVETDQSRILIGSSTYWLLYFGK